MFRGERRRTSSTATGRFLGPPWCVRASKTGAGVRTVEIGGLLHDELASQGMHPHGRPQPSSVCQAYGRSTQPHRPAAPGPRPGCGVHQRAFDR